MLGQCIVLNRILKDQQHASTPILEKLINPPIVTAILSIVLACFPIIRNTILPSQSYLENLILDSAISVGKAAPFILLFNAGINLGRDNRNDRDDDDNDVRPMKVWLSLIHI